MPTPVFQTTDNLSRNIFVDDQRMNEQSHSDLDGNHYKHDSKNLDNEVNFDEYEEVILEETLDADQFLHDLGAPSKNYSMFIDSESNNPSQTDLLNATINIFSNDHIDRDIDQLLQNTFLHQLTSTNQSTKRNMDSSIPIRSEISITSEFNSPAVSQNTIFFQEHYPDITADVPQARNNSRPSTRNSAVNIDDFPEKLPSVQAKRINSGVTSSPNLTNNKNRRSPLIVQNVINSEVRKDLIRNVNDNDTDRRQIAQSPSSSVIFFSPHVSHHPEQQQQQQQQQQLNQPSSIPSTIGKNNRHVNTEKREEIKRKKIDVTKKSIVTTISILPSSSSSPLKQVLPSSIIGNVQTQFTFENNRNNDNYNRKPSNTTLNTDAVHLSIEEQEKRLCNSNNCHTTSSSPFLVLQMHSQIQTTTSANDEGDQTPDRINSAERSLSRSTSSAHSSLKSNSGKKSTSRKSNSRHSSTAANERSHTNQQRHSSSSSSSSSNNHEVERPMTFPGERQETPRNENEEYLDDKPRSLQNFDERSLSDRSISQRSESGLSSSANSALPLNLDSSDLEDNEIPRSKTTSPQKRNSSLSKNPPQDQIQSPNPANGIHPERLSSRHSDENVSTAGHRKPIQSVNNTLEKELLSQPLQTKVHSPKALTFKQNGSSHEVEQKAKIQLPPMSSKNNTSLSNYKQEQNSTHQSPSISPVHFDERKRKVQKSPTSDSVKNTEGHHQTHENLTAQFKSNKNEHSTTISTRRHEVDDTNHTSIEGNATSSLILPNKKTNTSNTNHHTTKKQASVLSPIQPAFATEIQRRLSSHSQNEQLHREQKQSMNENASPSLRVEVRSTSPNDPNNEFFEPTSEREQRQRRVSFSGSPVHSFVEEQHMDPNWRERVASILASKHQPNEKYAYVQARVNSFENFDYHPRKFNVISRKIYHSKSDNEEDNVLELNQHKSKNPNDRKELFVQEQIGDEQHIHSIKDLPVQMFGRLMFLADGSPTIFHEPLEWHSASRLKEYSYENFNYTPRRKEVKIYDKKPRWHSESKLSDFVKESPRFFQRDTLAPANSLPHISDAEQAHLYQEQFDRRLQHHFPNNRSYTPILEEKDGRIRGPKVPQRRHDHIQDKSKDSTIQIFHKTPQWDGVPKFRMHSPARVHPSRTTLSNGQIFNEKLNWNARAKIHCWSELDLRKLDRKKAIVTYPNLKRNNRVLSPINPPKVSKHTKMIFDRPTRVRNSQLKDYVWENYNYKSHRRNRKTPPRKPKWNAVSKTRSLNSVYNPKVKNNDSTRRGWDRESRRKRVNKLPPLKRKREHEDLPQLPSNDQLAIDYNYERSPTTQAHTNRSEYALTSSRRSSKVLLPINHRQRFPDLELPNETTPRSHRPIQQEWYDEMNKSRLTHRMDGDGSNNHSFLHSVTPIHQSNTPRDLLPYRSTPRNSQNSGMSGTLLDTSIRTNRATEIRLAKNMDEHHQHCHDVSQSMPLEIRGFELEGTQCTVPVDATIRPLSNVNYRTSERVKNHRLYPWSMLHGPGTLSRNSSLLPIAEFRRPSLDTTITETQ